MSTRDCARFGLAMLAGLVLVSSVQAGDRHAGYYYPIPATSETYTARAKALDPGAREQSRTRRILFVTEITNQMLARPYSPPFAMFAKGDYAEKLIITSLHGDGYNTLYRMRGLLAMLTAYSRATAFFEAQRVQDKYTFLDLLKMLDFAQLTVTDGDNFAHRIYIE